MENSHSLALIAAYYLSRQDRDALTALNFSNFTAAFAEIGDRLGVNPNTVKNMRDEFDSVHDNTRVGWYQRPLRPSRARVVEMFEGVESSTLAGIVRDLLYSSDYAHSDEIQQTVVAVSTSEDASIPGIFMPRGRTGRQAEEKFIEWFNNGDLPFSGELKDRREDGCGYDFHIYGSEELLIEVKGLVGKSGGILMTDKEWSEARKHPHYRLFVAYDLASESPKWKLLDNIADLIPYRSVRTVVQVSWHLQNVLLE